MVTTNGGEALLTGLVLEKWIKNRQYPPFDQYGRAISVYIVVIILHFNPQNLLTFFVPQTIYFVQCPPSMI